MNKEIEKEIQDRGFTYAKSLYTHAKDEDIKESTQCDAYQVGATFGYSLAEAEIERLKTLLKETVEGAATQIAMVFNPEEKDNYFEALGATAWQQFKTDNKL